MAAVAAVELNAVVVDGLVAPRVVVCLEEFVTIIVDNGNNTAEVVVKSKIDAVWTIRLLDREIRGTGL